MAIRDSARASVSGEAVPPPAPLPDGGCRSNFAPRTRLSHRRAIPSLLVHRLRTLCSFVFVAGFLLDDAIAAQCSVLVVCVIIGSQRFDSKIASQFASNLDIQSRLFLGFSHLGTPCSIPSGSDFFSGVQAYLYTEIAYFHS